MVYVRHHNAPSAEHGKAKTGKTQELLVGKGILIKYSEMPPLHLDAQKGFMFHALMPIEQVIFKSRRWSSLNGNIQNASLILGVSL